jgi:putative glycosyltransferase
VEALRAEQPAAVRPCQVPPALSIVSTMYCSREFLGRFLDECAAAAEQTQGGSWEVVLVNDGSPDDSLSYALERRTADSRIVVVDLSRNFGHHHAMHAGLRHSRGDMIFLIDCDLEVRPAVLAEFVAKQRSSGADLVFGYQDARKGQWFEQWSGALFWRGLNALSEVPIPENMLTERLMTRRFVESLMQLGDYNLFLGGMMSWTGFVQVGIPLVKTQRQGRGTYTLLRRLRLMVTAVSSFSSRPLTWVFNVGLLVTALSFAYVLYLVVRKLVFDDALLGFTSLMGLMAMSLGIMTTALGVVGIYLGKVFNQVQNRPSYIVRDVHR